MLLPLDATTLILNVLLVAQSTEASHRALERRTLILGTKKCDTSIKWDSATRVFSVVHSPLNEKVASTTIAMDLLDGICSQLQETSCGGTSQDKTTCKNARRSLQSVQESKIAEMWNRIPNGGLPSSGKCSSLRITIDSKSNKFTPMDPQLKPAAASEAEFIKFLDNYCGVLRGVCGLEVNFGFRLDKLCVSLKKSIDPKQSNAGKARAFNEKIENFK